VRSGLCAVETTDFARWIEQRGCGSGAHGLEVGVLFGRRDVALLAGRGGDDGEPDDAFGGPFFLLRLDASAEVVLLVVGAAFVGSLEYDVFAAVCRESVLSAVGVGAFKVGGGGTGYYGERGNGGEG
jgi:hypothetical protein